MTMPDERTRALRFAREFLESLLSREEWPGLPEELRRQALVTLRHYPAAGELRLLHLALPQFYGPVDEDAGGGSHPNESQSVGRVNRTPAALEERSLDMHRAVAAKLRGDPSLLEIAKANNKRWRATTSVHAMPYRDAWQAVLDQGLEAVLRVILDPSEHGVTMRKASPFAGILTEVERQEILRAWRARHTMKG